MGPVCSRHARAAPNIATRPDCQNNWPRQQTGGAAHPRLNPGTTKIPRGANEAGPSHDHLPQWLHPQTQ
eukprot:8122699-Lingulodinium_polyedra.AAC.1